MYLFSYKVWSCYVKRFMRRCIYKKIQYLTFDLDPGVKVTRNVSQYPLHHVTYSATKFEVAKSNRLGGETFTRKYILWPWSWGQCHTKCCPVPSTSCDLFTYKVWSCFLKRFRRRYIYKKRDGRTDARTARQTDGRRTDFDTKINTCIPFFSKEKSGYNNEPCTVCIRFITVLFAPLRQYYKMSHVSNSNLPFWSVVRSFLKVWVYM